MTDNKFRAEFEVWYAPLMEAGCRENMACGPCGHYRKPSTELAWLAWQASRINYRASVLEEVAQACEDISDEYGDREGGKWPELKSDAQSGAKACENAIRALALKTAKEG